MRPTVAVIQTDRFSGTWGEGGDADPPPGHDFVESLFQHLMNLGATSNLTSVPENFWEHNNWYFFLEWAAEQFSIRVECSFADVNPSKWYIHTGKQLGFASSIATVFTGRRDQQQDVPTGLLDAIDNYLKPIAFQRKVNWITLKAYEDALSSD